MKKTLLQQVKELREEISELRKLNNRLRKDMDIKLANLTIVIKKKTKNYGRIRKQSKRQDNKF